MSMIQMNLFTKKKPTHGHREQTYGWGVRERYGERMVGEFGMDRCTQLFKMDGHQGPVV